MEVRVDRFYGDRDVTISRVYIRENPNDRFVFQCHSLEDEYRKEKIAGETRIPAGTYKLGVRKEGGFHNRYLAMFGASFHKGMLHVLNVPNFKWILIHIGNYHTNTAGCLLVGRADLNAGAVWASKAAYKKIYKKLISAALSGSASITYRDLDR